MSMALRAAIEANDTKLIRAAVKGVKDLNKKMPGSHPPLFYAAEVGADSFGIVNSGRSDMSSR